MCWKGLDGIEVTIVGSMSDDGSVAATRPGCGRMGG
jgi:hypothetical protein